jgi:toxin ParE1/3/4
MNRYKLSRQAEQDLEDIWVYLADQDDIRADKQVAQILNRLPMLAQYPDMGKSRDDLAPNLRSFPSKPYIVFYTKSQDRIEIIRVIHHSRNIEDLFQN